LHVQDGFGRTCLHQVDAEAGSGAASSRSKPQNRRKPERSAKASSRSQSDGRYPCRSAGTARPPADRCGRQTAQVQQ
jgi:hypothetical protein